MQRDGETRGRPGPVAWHPFVWAAYPVVWLYAQNAHEAWLRETVWPLIAALGLAALLGLLLRREVPAPGRRAAVVSPAIVVLLSYGHIESGVRRTLLNSPLSPVLDYLTLALSVALLGGLLVLVRILRTGPEIRNTTRFLNASAAAAIVLVLVQAASAAMARGNTATESVQDFAAPAKASGPDIFLIMLDAYAGLDQLEGYYGVDNQPFLEALETRGFYVAREAHGNYQWTALCMASLLNMRYALEPPKGPRRLPVSWNESAHSMRPRFLNNRVCADLRKRGYRIVAFETPQSGIQLKTADAYLSPGRALSEFQRAVLDRTLPMALFQEAGLPVERYLNDAHRRRRIAYIFNTLKTLGGREQPDFVLAHVMAPHPPFLFNRDGTPNRSGPADTEAAYRSGYAEQLLYVNRLVLDAVDAIQARLPEAVIVVQSDHGARRPGLRKGAPDPYAREYLSALNAVYVPRGAGYDTLTPAFSQVNTFRYLFNVLFDQGHSYQPDMSYLETTSGEARILVPLEWDGYDPVFIPVGADSPVEPWTGH